jgi:pro-sigmaK processing inhibitor BofA
MLKAIFSFIKKIIFSAFLLYGFNLIAAPIGLIIPINVITVLLLSILGIPALFSLIVILLLVF